MTYEVVVEAGELTAPDASVTMCSLRVTRIGETLGNGTPLHGEIVVVVERSHLVDAPAEGTVVEDDAGLVALPGCIRTVIDVLFLSAAYAEETDDVVAARLNGVISEGDARRWGSLSEDGDVVSKLEIRLQGDDASHIEDDDSLTRLYSLSERTCSAVVEIGYMYYFSASSSRYVSSVTFCARKGWSLCQSSSTHESCSHCCEYFLFHWFKFSL